MRKQAKINFVFFFIFIFFFFLEVGSTQRKEKTDIEKEN